MDDFDVTLLPYSFQPQAETHQLFIFSHQAYFSIEIRTDFLVIQRATHTLYLVCLLVNKRSTSIVISFFLRHLHSEAPSKNSLYLLPINGTRFQNLTNVWCGFKLCVEVFHKVRQAGMIGIFTKTFVNGHANSSWDYQISYGSFRKQNWQNHLHSTS